MEVLDGLHAPWLAAEVAEWAKRTFRAEVAAHVPDEHIHLAKACLLLALEEEAAQLVGDLHPELREIVLAKPNLRWVDPVLNVAVAASAVISMPACLTRRAGLMCRPRSMASASTWSLERLDALAAEVAVLLDQQEQHGQGGLEGEQEEGSAAAGGASSNPAGQALPQLGAAGEPAAAQADGMGLAAKLGMDASSSSATGAAEHGASGQPQGAAGAGAPPGQRGYDGEGDADGSMWDDSLGPHSASSHMPADAETDTDTGQGPGAVGVTGDALAGKEPCAVRAQYSRPRLAEYASRVQPVELLTAVNTVLFERHGYKACNRYGVVG